MRKTRLLRILFVVVCAIGGLLTPFKVGAQTDVTSTYLTNANFEGSFTVHSYPREDGDNKRAIYKPDGWTIAYTNGETNDVTALNSDCYQWNNFSSRQQPVNGGNNVYWIRFRWGSNASIKLSQTVSMSAGTYRVSADAFWISSSSTATLSAAGLSVTIDSRNAWANYGVVFTISTTTNVEIAYTFTQTAQAECIAGVDNFKIESFDQSTTDLSWSWTTMISNAGMELGTSTSNAAGWDASSVNTPYGFTLSTTVDGWKDGTINTTNPSEGSKLYNLWAGTVTSTDMYQDIVLPMGKYTITADMRIDNMQYVNDQGVYAKVRDITYKSGTITSVAGTWNSAEGWNKLSKTFYVSSDKSSVRVGVSSTGSSACQGWYQLDNFTLTYLGSVAKAATNLTLGVATTLTAGKWYSLNVGSTDYQFTSTAATTMYYTQTGYESPGDVTSTLALSAGNTVQELANGTLYFRVANATTLTVSAINYSAGQDLTSLITNPSFESNGSAVNLSAENLTGVTGWTLASASNTNDVGTRAYGNEGSTYYSYNGVGDYCFNCYWEGKPLTQSLGSLPAGTYELSALVTTGNDSSIGTVYLNANSNVSTGYARKGAASYFFREKLVFTLTEPTSVTIGIRGGNDIEGNASKGAYNENGYWWYKCDDFQLTYLCKPTQANLYIQLSALLSDCAPWTTSGEYYTNYTTYSAYTASNTVAELTAAINYLTNEYEKYALANATSAHPYDMGKIINPSYDDGQSSWSTALNQTGGGGYSVASDGTQTNYFNSSYNSHMRHSSVYQEGILLDEGIYKLSAKMKGTPKDDVSTFIYATTGAVDHWGGTLFASDTYYGYLTTAAAASWSEIDTYITLDAPKRLRIGVLSWGNNWSGGNGGAFSVDDWKIEKIDNAVVSKDGVVTAYGAAPLGTINAALTSSVGAVNLQKTTGLTSSSISTTNNPNLLIFANSGQVSNSNNVIIDGTCSNLVLADGHPFVNPTSFTATNAQYTLSALAGGSFATLMIPFNATKPSGSVYALDQGIDLIDGNVRGTSASIEANKPVLVTAAGNYTGSSVTVPVVASGATYTNGELVGTYTAMPAVEGSYVLQNHTSGEGVAFYLVGSTKPTVNPFRAYIKKQANNVKAISVMFDADGIQAIDNGKLTIDNAEIEIYNIAGQRLSKPQRGVNIIKGKKVIIK